MNARFDRQNWKLYGALLLGMASAGIAAEDRPQTRPATAPAATQPVKRAAIPLIYANPEGKPFPKVPAEEVARIVRRAGEMTPPGKEVWFILIRNGSWFPAAEVYCTPQKIDGRLCSGQYAMIWRKDSEKAIGRLNGGNRWDDYVMVVEPNAPIPKAGADHAPPPPKSSWLPFRRPEDIDDKLIIEMVDKVQEDRKQDKDHAGADPSMPIMAIERHEKTYEVLVAWPDQGYEDFCIVKAMRMGLKWLDGTRSTINMTPMSLSHDAVVGMLINEFGQPKSGNDLQKGIGWDISDNVGLYLRKSDRTGPSRERRHVLVYVPTSTLVSMPDFGMKVEATGKKVGRSLGSFRFAGLGANHDVVKLRITDTSELQRTVDYVRSLLGTSIGAGAPLPAPPKATANPSPTDPPFSPSEEDRRAKAVQQVALRQGQTQFRQALFERYGRQCMISGCQILDVIQAAHIQPYLGDNNAPQNGLLLRADIHNLFDVGLLGIHPDTLEIHLHASLVASEYAEFHGVRLRCEQSTPNEAALRIRWRQFEARRDNQTERFDDM